MTNEKILKCDFCHKYNIEKEHWAHIKLFVGRQSNGVEFENEYRDYDFCPSCSTTILTLICNALEKNDTELNKVLSNKVDKN